jgi:hypothetical protein
LDKPVFVTGTQKLLSSAHLLKRARESPAIGEASSSTETRPPICVKTWTNARSRERETQGCMVVLIKKTTAEKDEKELDKCRVW